MVMWTRKTSPRLHVTLRQSMWETRPAEMRKERQPEERTSCLHTNGCHASTSNYRRMKYELQLIFLPGVTVLRVLRTLGIYLGSKLTSFVEWPERCNLCSVTSTSLWLLILDTCPFQKLAGQGCLDKDVEQCNYQRKGLAEADQGRLSSLLCANGTYTASIQKREGHPYGSTANFLGWRTSPGLLNSCDLSSHEEDNRKLWLWE